ncbi:hypothetical protein ACFWM0_18740 [Streptomyces sp. NPDC058405]|uniref:hypothetical protein n=1 Tax=unclassified Streptomyces TaxID=2593676 RepID=UPI00364F798F
MRRALALPLLVALLLGASACSDEGGDSAPKDSAAAQDSACEELLGDAGLKWLESRTGGPGKAHMRSDDGLEEARTLFYDQVLGWDPDSDGVPSFVTAEVCKARTDVADPRKQLALQFGASLFPFDSPFDAKSDIQAEPAVTPVGPDVKLVHGKDRDGTVRYRVYVKCRIAGAPAEQENEIPVEGQLADTLTGETSARVHLTRLLHSAGVMTKNLGCENKPLVPAEPPASVK